MQGRKRITITLGDLIVVISDEIRRFIQDPLSVNLVVAAIVSEVLADDQVHVRRRLRRNMARSAYY
jgi:hypothetical protein